MKAVRKGPISINKAALLHGVPPTTLKDRLSGRVEHGTKPGPVKYLNNEETRRQVKVIVENVEREKKLL